MIEHDPAYALLEEDAYDMVAGYAGEEDEISLLVPMRVPTDKRSKERFGMEKYMKERKRLSNVLSGLFGVMIGFAGAVIWLTVAEPDVLETGTADTMSITGSQPTSEKQAKYDRYIEKVLADDILSYYDFSAVNLDLTYNESEDIYTTVVIIVTKDDITINQVRSIDDES